MGWFRSNEMRTKISIGFLVLMFHPLLVNKNNQKKNHFIHFLVTLAHGKFAIGSLDEIEISCDLID